MRVAIVCRPDLRSFIGGIEEVLRNAGHAVIQAVDNQGRIAKPEIDEADVVWCEWAAEHAAVTVANTETPAVVRLHRYEAYTPSFQQIMWSNVAALIGTSDHILALARHRVPALDDLTDVHMIPSGVWFDRYTRAKKDEAAMRRIGVASYLHGRKQPGLWVQVLNELPEGYSLHVAGKEQEGGWTSYLLNLAHRLGLGDSVHFDGWRDDIGAWWQDKGHCLSAAADEGCPYNVIEAVACGALPAVHSYVGADDQWPGSTWNTPVGGALLIHDERHASGIYDFARERYDLAAQAPRILEIVEGAAS